MYIYIYTYTYTVEILLGHDSVRSRNPYCHKSVADGEAPLLKHWGEPP